MATIKPLTKLNATNIAPPGEMQNETGMPINSGNLAAQRISVDSSSEIRHSLFSPAGNAIQLHNEQAVKIRGILDTCFEEMANFIVTEVENNRPFSAEELLRTIESTSRDPVTMIRQLISLDKVDLTDKGEDLKETLYDLTADVENDLMKKIRANLEQHNIRHILNIHNYLGLLNAIGAFSEDSIYIDPNISPLPLPLTVETEIEHLLHRAKSTEESREIAITWLDDVIFGMMQTLSRVEKVDSFAFRDLLRAVTPLDQEAIFFEQSIDYVIEHLKSIGPVNLSVQAMEIIKSFNSKILVPKFSVELNTYSDLIEFIKLCCPRQAKLHEKYPVQDKPLNELSQLFRDISYISTQFKSITSIDEAITYAFFPFEQDGILSSNQVEIARKHIDRELLSHGEKKIRDEHIVSFYNLLDEMNLSLKPTYRNWFLAIVWKIESRTCSLKQLDYLENTLSEMSDLALFQNTSHSSQDGIFTTMLGDQATPKGIHAMREKLNRVLQEYGHLPILDERLQRQAELIEKNTGLPTPTTYQTWFETILILVRKYEAKNKPERTTSEFKTLNELLPKMQQAVLSNPEITKIEDLFQTPRENYRAIYTQINRALAVVGNTEIPQDMANHKILNKATATYSDLFRAILLRIKINNANKIRGPQSTPSYSPGLEVKFEMKPPVQERTVVTPISKKSPEKKKPVRVPPVKTSKNEVEKKEAAPPQQISAPTPPSKTKNVAQPQQKTTKVEIQPMPPPTTDRTQLKIYREQLFELNNKRMSPRYGSIEDAYKAMEIGGMDSGLKMFGDQTIPDKLRETVNTLNPEIKTFAEWHKALINFFEHRKLKIDRMITLINENGFYKILRQMVWEKGFDLKVFARNSRATITSGFNKKTKTPSTEILRRIRQTWVGMNNNIYSKEIDLLIHAAFILNPRR
ncbi:MAG: hypothetical protein ABIE74_12995 [Pseudomonadota bacterium]